MCPRRESVDSSASHTCNRTSTADGVVLHTCLGIASRHQWGISAHKQKQQCPVSLTRWLVLASEDSTCCCTTSVHCTDGADVKPRQVAASVMEDTHCCRSTGSLES